MTPDQRLKAAFAFDEPPARDYRFTAEVMQAVARRRLILSLVMLLPPTIAAMAVLWAVAPQFEPLFETGIQALRPAAAIVTVAAFLAAISWRVLRPLRARAGL